MCEEHTEILVGIGIDWSLMKINHGFTIYQTKKL